jgi:inorganic pyrophosphatase
LFVLPIKAARFDHVRSVMELPQRVRDEIEQFFINVVAFEGKDLRVLGFAGPEEGDRLVRAAVRA